ncbi:piggyBac transposable element-derived protein 3-like [Littorina saxatilis]|uniref:piggyBac transposable element-derived protein 3-like n=1 Tax=Littorina saxatilis TaxID=31220 RepID=UPI0038B614CB
MTSKSSRQSQLPRRMNVHDVLSQLEEDGFFNAAVYITPPGDGELSDEDSGEEDGGGQVNNLNRRQLHAEAEGVVTRSDGQVVRMGGPNDETELDQDPPGRPAPPQPVPASPQSVPASPQSVPASPQSVPASPQSVPASPQSVPASPQSVPASPQQAPALRNLRNRQRNQPAPIQVPVPRQQLAGRLLQNQRQQRLQQPAVRNWRREDLPRNLNLQQQWPVLPQAQFLNENLNPLEMFELFIDDDVVDYIVDQTNLYARRDKGNHTFVTTRQEFRTFMAILLLSGYNQIPRRTMYWERNTDCHNTAVSGAMSRNRFDEHMRFLHLADNNTLDPNDKVSKVRAFVSMINERCLLYFPEQQHLSIDESMVPYFGHHLTKQFIRGKPIRFGFKLWTLADPLGYVVQFEPYTGAGGGQPYGRLGLGGTVVKDLISELPQRPYYLTFDNFFTSLPLLSDLAANGIGATGTIRKNRIEHCLMRDATRFAKEDRGALDFRHDRRSNVLVVEWNDNSVVTVASNCDRVMPLARVRRWSRAQRQFVQIEQPDLIRVYNATMGGVDRADQNINAYRISLRTKKWWWPYFAHVLELVMQNAWLLFRRTDAHTAEPLDLLAFR